MKKIALLSVFNKDGIVEFAKQLIDLDFEILASGGTAKTLTEAGLSVIDIKDIVGEPILGHRVVTLSREIHAGLLAQNNDEDRAELQRLGIRYIDLLYCNFYPLEDEIKSETKTKMSVIEKTDIGGPTMVRSAAKGRRIVIVDPEDKEMVLRGLESGEDTESLRDSLAAKAEFLVGKYCIRSASYHSNEAYRATFFEKTGTTLTVS